MLHINTDSKFKTLSVEDKESVLLFLQDRLTEEYVKITQYPDGLIEFNDYQECEFQELADKDGYIKRNKLLRNIFMLDYKDFTYVVDKSLGWEHIVTAKDGTIFSVRHDDSDNKNSVYFHYLHAFHNVGKNKETLVDVCSRVSGGKSRVVTTAQKIEERKVDKKDNFVTSEEWMLDTRVTGVCVGKPAYLFDNGGDRV
jgi:hypothetical protein